MSRFSDFIRNASEEDRAKVYGRVIDAAILAQKMQAHGCRKPSIANMDSDRSFDAGEPDRRVNRCCLTCLRHWAGPVDAVKEYTRAEWDAYVEQAFWVDPV